MDDFSFVQNCNNSSFRNDVFSTVSGIYTLCLKQPCRIYGGAGTLFPDLDRIYRHAFSTREHMSLVLLQESLKPEGRRILMICIDTLILIFAIFIITIGGFKLAMSAQKVYSALLGIPRSLVYAMAPVSGIFIIIAQLINLYEDVTGIKIEGGNES